MSSQWQYLRPPGQEARPGHSINVFAVYHYRAMCVVIFVRTQIPCTGVFQSYKRPPFVLLMVILLMAYFLLLFFSDEEEYSNGGDPTVSGHDWLGWHVLLCMTFSDGDLGDCLQTKSFGKLQPLQKVRPQHSNMPV